MTGEVVTSIYPLPSLHAEEGLPGKIPANTATVGTVELALGGLEEHIYAGQPVAEISPNPTLLTLGDSSAEPADLVQALDDASDIETQGTVQIIAKVVTDEAFGRQPLTVESVTIEKEQETSKGSRMAEALGRMREFPAHRKRKGGGRLRTCLNYPWRIAPGRLRACNDCLAGVVPSHLDAQF